MANEYMRGCPECSMCFGMNAPLSKVEDRFQCTANPTHKFRVGPDGFLKSV